MGRLKWLRLIDGRAVCFWLKYLSVCLLLWMIFAVWVPASQHKQRMATAKQNLHAIQLALERYAVDSDAGNYPVDIYELSTTGYLPKFPENPFTGKPMHPVSPGEKPRTGDFMYCPKGDYATDEGPPVRYELQLFF